MKKVIYILLFIFIILNIGFAVDVTDYFKVKETNVVTLSCFSNSLPCTDTYNCNLTLLDPQNNKIIDNQGMEYGNPFYYNLSSAEITKFGDYHASAICYNSTDSQYTTFMIRSNYNGTDYISNNNLGIYIILAIMIAAYIYASFAINKKHIIIKFVLLISGIVNCLAGLLLAYLDNSNTDLNYFIFGLATANIIAFIYITYNLMVRVVEDANDEKEKKDNNL